VKLRAKEPASQLKFPVPGFQSAKEDYSIRCVSINTHRGRGPKVSYLLKNASKEEAERIMLLHDTRIYTYYIAEWIHQHRDKFDIVCLQEVFDGWLGFGDRFLKKYRQRDHYRVISGFESYIKHHVGFAAFRYENLLLSQLPRLSETTSNYLLPGKVFFLASCGFTLVPFLLKDIVVWVGNTHMHPYNPHDRAKQAASIVREIKKLGDVPLIFMGDFNTVPLGCKNSDFPAGERDVKSYVGDTTLEIFQAAGLQMTKHADEQKHYTYPTGSPNRTLDYILFTKHWDAIKYEVLTDFQFSDHYPVFGEFRLKD
jgi:endonuclease/exonuclease/phosphatase family metal-dependent hydrolase